MTSRRPIEEREAIHHAAAVVGKFRAYTYKELETVRAAPELLGAPSIGGGSARHWGGGGEFPRSHIYLHSQKRRKTGGFAHVLAYKSPKTPFFALKYLTRYTHEMFFKEYINIKIFRHLSHCEVIPVRSFRSHIRPQPHGLG
jgi:hypothetical protein